MAVPSGPDAAGTEVLLEGVPDGEMERAKSFFLCYNHDGLLESTNTGTSWLNAIRRPPGGFM